MKYFTGVGTQVGNRISILSDLLSSKEEPPRVWYNPNYVTTPRLVESLRFGVLEVQEHLDTFFDRKDHIQEVSRFNAIIICTAPPPFHTLKHHA